MDGDDSVDADVSSGRWLRLVVLFVLLVAAVSVLVVAGFLASEARRVSGKIASAEAYLGAQLAALPDAVQVLVTNHEPGARLASDQLPDAIRVPGLIGARIGQSSVTLVLTANPDTDRGFRVWLNDQDPEYEDRKTQVPGVYSYTYCDDYDQSPTNRPW